jgi:EmrB/QacA subfamily drug resistance transporter
MFVLGLAVFTLASAAAALSTGSGELIVARVLQGAGAAIITPLSLTLVSDAFPGPRRGMAFGVWSGVAGLGVAAGPVVGGAVIQGISWHWIFWLNVPVGLILIPLATLRLRESHGPRPQLDFAGLCLIGAGMVGLTWAPVRAPSLGWGSPEVLASFAVGVALVVAFLAWERRTRFPMLPLEFFRSRGFSLANAVAFCQFCSILGSLFLMTQLFQIGFGYSPLAAGVHLLPWMALPMIGAPIAGILGGRFGTWPFMLAGVLLQGTGLALTALVVHPGVGYGSLVLPLIIAGTGTSMCLPSAANMVVSSVPLSGASVASGTNSAVRQLGGVFGVAAVAAVFARNGGYATPATFIAGFKPALATVAGTATLGAVIAAFAPRRTVRPVEPPALAAPAGVGAVNGDGFVQDAVGAADFGSPAV